MSAVFRCAFGFIAVASMAACARDCGSEIGAAVTEVQLALSKNDLSSIHLEEFRTRMRHLVQRCDVPHAGIEVPMTGTYDQLDLIVLADDIDAARKAMSTNPAEWVCKAPQAKGHSPESRMHRVARWGSPNMLKAFVEFGCSVDIEDGGAGTPLQASIGGVQSKAENSRLLLSLGANPNAVDADGMTALDYAILDKDIDVVRALIEGGAKVRPRGPDDAHTLELLSKEGTPEIQMLLKGAKQPEN